MAFGPEVDLRETEQANEIRKDALVFLWNANRSNTHTRYEFILAYSKDIEQ